MAVTIAAIAGSLRAGRTRGPQAVVASPALAGPELIFLRGRQAYLVGAELPSRAREIAAERARVARYLRTT